MRIALVYYESFDPRSQNDSIPIWIHNVATKLVSNNSIIVYLPQGNHQKKDEFYQGVQYKRISSTFDDWIAVLLTSPYKLIPGFEKATRKTPYFASIFNKFTYILKVAKEIQASKCDIVHIQEETEFIPTIRALNPTVKIVLHMHCVWLTQLNYNMIENRLKKADLIISCSDYITNQNRKKFHSMHEKFQTLYNGVDLSRYTPDPKKNIEKKEFIQLLTVGRVTPEKGLHILIEALKEVIKKVPNVHLNIIGPLNSFGLNNIIWLSEDSEVHKLEAFYKKRNLKAYYEYLKQKITSYNLLEKVTFHGQILHKETIKFYQSADLLIQPSIIPEPFGMPIIEAMACQVPVIASKVGGIPELIEDSKTGRLIKRNDSQVLADVILKLINNKELAENMGKLSLIKVQKFSWNNISSKLESFYKNC